MISIRHSLEELDRQEQRLRLLLERQRTDSEREQTLIEQQGLVLNCYSSAIQSIREYAIEIDPHLTGKFRSRMTELEVDLERASQPQDYATLQSSLRGELRQYRDRGQAVVSRLRTEVTEAATAMQALTDAVSEHGAGYQAELTRELATLEAAASCDDLPTVQATIHSSAAAIQRSFEQMRRANEGVIAQLQDEIRSLHKTMETERRLLHVDQCTGTWNRRRLAERIDDLLRRDESFGLLLIVVTNWKRLAQQHSQEAADASLKSLATRLADKFGVDGLVGRWSEDVLAVIVETDPRVAATMTANTDREFSAPAPAGAGGDSRQPPAILEIRSVLIGRECGTDAGDFYPQIGQRVSALTR